MHRLALIIVMSLGLPTMLRAQQVSFDDADTDKDGRASRDEYQASRKRQFERFDTNRDGVASSNDFAHMPTRRTSLDKVDADEDGYLTEREMAKLREALSKRRRRSL